MPEVEAAAAVGGLFGFGDQDRIVGVDFRPLFAAQHVDSLVARDGEHPGRHRGLRRVAQVGVDVAGFGGAGDNRLSYNRWGRMDGGGRYLGDSDNNFRSCSEYSDNNTAMLDSMSRGGNNYPCQRFR